MFHIISWLFVMIYETLCANSPQSRDTNWPVRDLSCKFRCTALRSQCWVIN